MKIAHSLIPQENSQRTLARAEASIRAELLVDEAILHNPQRLSQVRKTLEEVLVDKLYSPWRQDLFRIHHQVYRAVLRLVVYDLPTTTELQEVLHELTRVTQGMRQALLSSDKSSGLPQVAETPTANESAIEVCRWREDFEGTWTPGCWRDWLQSSENPLFRKYRYCPGCGKPISPWSYTQK